MASSEQTFKNEETVSFWESIKENYAPTVREIKYSIYLLRRSPLFLLGFGIMSVILLLGILAPYITPYDPFEISFGEKLLPPSGEHFLGTDNFGGDLWTKCIYAIGFDLGLALTVISISLFIGLIVGLTAGFFGGIVDETIMRITDVFLALPGLVLAIAIASAIGQRNLTVVMMALVVVWWSGYARLIRGQVLSEKEKLYVEASRAIGASNLRIMFKHVLPNSIYPVLVQVTLDLGGVVLTAAGLSFIGLGAQPPSPEWGIMIAEGREYIFEKPWAVTFPGLFILATSLAFNLMGDGLRDVLDPRLRR